MCHILLSALMSRPVHCRRSCGDTRTWTLHKHADQRHTNTKTALFSPAGYSLCLTCLHWSLWVSWRVIRACQTLSGYHTEDITWGQTRSLWIENLLRLSSLICAAVSRAAFECDSFAFEMHPGADGEEMIICLFSWTFVSLDCEITMLCFPSQQHTGMYKIWKYFYAWGVCWKQTQNLCVKSFSADGILPIYW